MKVIDFDPTGYQDAVSKQRISLDQFVLSNICKPNMGPDYLKLKASLTKAHNEGRIICPVHADEFLWESSPIPEPGRTAIVQLQDLLSDNFRFLNFLESISLESLHRINGTLYPRILKAKLDAAPEKWQKLKQEKANDGDAFKHKAATVIYGDEDRLLSVEQVWRVISSRRANAMLEVIKDFENGNHKAIKIGSELDRNLAIGVLGYLTEEYNFDPAKIDELAELVNNRKWESIPTLWFHARLWGQLEFRSMHENYKIEYGDVLDIFRLAVAFVDADMIICDNAMYELLKQSKILTEFPESKVYSARQLNEAAIYIDSVHRHEFPDLTTESTENTEE